MPIRSAVPRTTAAAITTTESQPRALEAAIARIASQFLLAAAEDKVRILRLTAVTPPWVPRLWPDVTEQQYIIGLRTHVDPGCFYDPITVNLCIICLEMYECGTLV